MKRSNSNPPSNSPCKKRKTMTAEEQKELEEEKLQNLSVDSAEEEESESSSWKLYKCYVDWGFPKILLRQGEFVTRKQLEHMILAANEDIMYESCDEMHTFDLTNPTDKWTKIVVKHVNKIIKMNPSILGATFDRPFNPNNLRPEGLKLVAGGSCLFLLQTAIADFFDEALPEKNFGDIDVYHFTEQSLANIVRIKNMEPYQHILLNIRTVEDLFSAYDLACCKVAITFEKDGSPSKLYFTTLAFRTALIGKCRTFPQFNKDNLTSLQFGINPYEDDIDEGLKHSKLRLPKRIVTLIKRYLESGFNSSSFDYYCPPPKAGVYFGLSDVDDYLALKATLCSLSTPNAMEVNLGWIGQMISNRGEVVKVKETLYDGEEYEMTVTKWRPCDVESVYQLLFRDKQIGEVTFKERIRDAVTNFYDLEEPYKEHDKISSLRVTRYMDETWGRLAWNFKKNLRRVKKYQQRGIKFEFDLEDITIEKLEALSGVFYHSIMSEAIAGLISARRGDSD